MCDLSIIIVNWNTEDLLKNCIRSIYEETHKIRYEIFVVDNASSDGSCQMIEREFPQVRLIRNKENLGFARGNNIGYKQSSGKYIVILNPDTAIQSNIFLKMLKFAEANPEVGIVGGLFLDPSGALQRHYRRFPTVGTIFFCYTRLGQIVDRFLFRSKFNSLYRLKDCDFSSVTPVDQVSASCLLISRPVIEKINGLFDEKFPILFNDVDLCRRVWKRGFKVMVLPAAKVIHIGSQSLKLLSYRDFLFYQNKGIVQYFKKHESTISTWLIHIIISYRRRIDVVFNLLWKIRLIKWLILGKRLT